MSASVMFPPALVLILGGLLLPLLQPRFRAGVLLALPVLTLYLVWQVPDGPALTRSFLGLELVPVRGDALARLFATVFTLAAFAGGLFALSQEKVTELAAAFAYAGGAVGVVLAGDLVTLFIFWELMGIASTLVLLSRGKAAAPAAMRYALIHVAGGVLLMAGIAGEIAATGSTSFERMTLDSPARWLILAGFLVNAGAPPLSAWLPDAYPESSWSGMVFLSAFTTKTAVYALMRGFPGTELLIFVGLVMVFYGIVYAILENDMRRILAYSIVSQVGFMVTAVGIGTDLAINGAAAHAFAHIIYKALLLMAAGSVLVATGKRRCSELGGLAAAMPLTTACCIVGALSISAFPLTSGFVTKSMIVDAAGEQHLALVWFLLTAASAGTFFYVGISFLWLVFFQQPAREPEPGAPMPADPPWNMRWAMLLLAGLCLAIGILPWPLYAMLPYPVHFEPYTASHVVLQLQLLAFTGLAFYLLMGRLQRRRTITLDLDWLYRRPGPALARRAAALGRQGTAAVHAALAAGGRGMAEAVRRAHGPHTALARTWTTGAMAISTIVVLAAYLLLAIF